jgi:exopolysaccharide biosynthesis polyprenyl glycosylphosphotransferase
VALAGPVVAPRRRPAARPAPLHEGQRLLALDAVALGLATLSTSVLAALTGAGPVPAVSLVAFPLLTLVLLGGRGAHRRRLRRSLLDELRGVVIAAGVAAMATVCLEALAGPGVTTLAHQGRQLGLAVAFLASARLATGAVARRARAAGSARVLIVGPGRIGTTLAARMLESPWLRLHPVGFLDPAPFDAVAHDPLPVPIVGSSADLERVVLEREISHVVLGFSGARHQVELDLVARCHALGVTVSIVPRLFEKVTDRLEVEWLGGVPLQTVDPADPYGWQFAAKHAVDRVAAAAGLVVFAPLLAAAGVAVWVSVGRPILYRQQRVGRDGCVFMMLKLRSMTHADNEEAGDDPGEDDLDRVTRVGRLLRRASLDELPQLVNVLRGEMSLVGPRPERPELAAGLRREIHRFDERHRVKAGITGWAQVHGVGRGANRFATASYADRVELDNHYIENWCLWLDVKILLLTVAAVLRFRQS